jgi:hypothetical protein
MFISVPSEQPEGQLQQKHRVQRLIMMDNK